MTPLSQQLAELSVQAKDAENRVSKALSEAKERTEQQRQQLREETEIALEKVSKGLADASADAQARVRQLKSKVDSDLEQLKQHTSETRHKFEAWQANNYANDKDADAAACIDYAIASVKVAELAVLDAIDTRLRAAEKAEQTHPA